jgi:hypothetical protein
MRGNAMELVEKIEVTFESGSKEDLEKYVQEKSTKPMVQQAVAPNPTSR